ncbi:MAG TPA: hypothetical protein VFX25_39440 [Streptosporangiaceae bacterium]|nr:hypothetical protein [Streptosporangiaceae bacterium]
MSGGERRWDGEESAERLVNAADHLERAYGRMLRWYPAGHQARHADEMLGVLMASAGPGRRLLIVAAVPLYFYVVILVETPGLYLASPLLDLPLVAVAGVAVLLAGRRARAWGRRAAAGDSG